MFVYIKDTVKPLLLAAAIPVAEPTTTATFVGIVAAAITGLVLLSFLHGVPRGRAVALATGVGRWLMLAGIGGWLGYLLFSRLLLLSDRVGFLVGDWLGIGR